VDERNSGVILNVQAQPGANTISVVKSIKLLFAATGSKPSRVDSSHDAYGFDDGDSGVGSDVEFELMLTIGLVVLVIFHFSAEPLRDYHSERCGAVVAVERLPRCMRSGTAWITFL